MAEPRDHKFREQWWRQIESDPNPDIADGLLAAAYAISTNARVDGTRALMSNRRLAQILKKNERTARRHTQKLRDLGYLELAERGGRRGDGTIAANVYELSLPFSTGHLDDPWANSQQDTQVSFSEDSQQDTWVSPWGDSQQDKSASQPDKSASQPDKSASQPDTQMSTPSLNPSLDPSLNPSYRAASSPAEAAVVNAYSTTRVSNNERNVGIRNLKQDQKQERLEEGPRCAVHGCGATAANHDRWMKELEQAGFADWHRFKATP
jgi:DNA-binding transcriptional ArsR family regulator